MIDATLPTEQAVEAYIREIYARGIALGKTRLEFHRFLQNEVAALASKFSFAATKEYVLANFRGNRNGRIDVVWTIGSIPVVAIEIDARFRAKSIRKLLSSKSNLQFWVYYGVRPFEPFVNAIDVAGRIKTIHVASRFVKPRPSHGSPASIERTTEQPPTIKKYSLAEIRRQWPNAYEIWSDEQDRLLETRFYRGLPISEIAKALQRRPSAIRARIRKLKLE